MKDNIPYGRSQRFGDHQGCVFVTHLHRGNLLVTPYGASTLRQIEFICGECDRAIADAGQFVFYTDARQARIANADARERIAAYMNSHKAQMLSSHVLFSSRMASMGVALVNMMTGGALRTYSNPGDFENMIRKQVPLFRGLPNFDDQFNDSSAATSQS